MILADWITLGIFVVFAGMGTIMGLGKCLKFFTRGIFGIIISIFVCYYLYGVVINWQFVQELLDKLLEAIIAANNPFCQFLVDINIEVVLLWLILFCVVQLLRVIVVAIIKNVVEINNVVFKTINKIFGMIFMVCIATMLYLFVFQIIEWIGGNTVENVKAGLSGSFFKLDYIFENNPLKMIYEYFKHRAEEPAASLLAVI